MVRKLLVLGVLSLALTACSGHPVQRKLEGRWVGQGVENVEDESLAQATGWAKGTSFEFRGNELTVSIPNEEPRKGKYQVLGVHNADVRIAVKDAAGKQYDLKLLIDDEHGLRWQLGQGRTIVLRRDG